MVKKMATNSVMASYQEVIDVSTVPGKVGIFGIHTPDNVKPIKMLEGFYRQFRQMKYLGCSVKVQPAATLPADPLSVSYEAGEVATDPRDLLNPIMVKGCHGETMNNALDVIFKDNAQGLGTSIDRYEYDFTEVGNVPVGIGDGMYYSALSDPSFRKYGVLQPFALNGLHPLVHQVVGTMPIYPKQTEQGLDMDYGQAGSLQENSDLNYTESIRYYSEGLGIPEGITTRVGYNSAGEDGGYVNGTIFTSKMQRLGWLDTLSRPQAVSVGRADYNPTKVKWSISEGSPVPVETPYRFNTIPKLFMACMIMPPCYKTILSFRMVITHRIAFRGFTTARYVLGSDFSPSDYTNNLNAVATADAASILQDPVLEQSASVESINGDATTITEGVF